MKNEKRNAISMRSTERSKEKEGSGQLVLSFESGYLHGARARPQGSSCQGPSYNITEVFRSAAKHRGWSVRGHGKQRRSDHI